MRRFQEAGNVPFRPCDMCVSSLVNERDPSVGLSKRAAIVNRAEIGVVESLNMWS